MRRISAILLSLLLTVSLLTACGDHAELQDGYYTAQASEFSHGWKEYITVLVKGGDYQIADIVGADFVQARGGIVTTVPFVEGKSTTGMINRMQHIV